MINCVNAWMDHRRDRNPPGGWTHFRFLSFTLILLTAAVIPAEAGCMDTDNAYWIGVPAQRATFDKLMGLMACPTDADNDTGRQVDSVACNYFVAKGLEILYGVKDFTPDLNGKWLTANEIANYVRSHTDVWTKLGEPITQSLLVDAAAGAANGQPVIAVLKGDPHGHVAMILAGDLKRSTTWNMNVPNSAAFSLNNVNKAYVFCRLSAAFSNPSDVGVYFRLKK
jgi:hypothetical protein